MTLLNKTVACDLCTVEKYFINNGTNISNKKLQKLLYFAQAWFIAFYNDEENFDSSSIYKLFKEDIEAWRHGPVIPDSYYKFNNYHSDNIKKKPEETLTISLDLKKFLDEVLTVYDKYSADNLESISQQHQPWKTAFQPGQNNIIDLQNIFNFYIKEM